MMLSASDFVRNWGLLVVIGLAALFALWRLGLRNPSARMAWHARTLRLPVLGRYMLGVDVARFSATLAILTGSNVRSEEHTSELQSLMRISYAVFCLKKKNTKTSR